MAINMSGIEKIDTITGGFLPGELVLLCGRAEMGKTTLLSRILLNVAQKAVRDKNPEFALYLTLDNASHSKYPRFRGIRNLQSEAVIVDNTSAISVDEIAEKLTSLKKTHRISVVAIDYLQLIKPKKAADCDRKEELTAIVSGVKQLAADENVCILLTANLPRKVDRRRDHTPLLTDLEMIGDIEQLVDMVIFLLRPYYITDDHGRTLLQTLPGPTTVTIAKNRHGSIGTCELRIKEFGISDMTYWTWNQSNLPQIASEIKDGMQRAANGRSIFIPQYHLNYFNIRYHLRWLFFGSPGDGKPDEAKRHSNGYVVNGLRMNDDDFARLNAGLRWPLAEDDPILDHDISECFMEFDQSRIPEQYNAICPLDGYVLAINAEYYWRLPPGEHVAEGGPDSVYRLCPHCLMDLASRNIIRRCIRGGVD
jgi:hypothetical protein